MICDDIEYEIVRIQRKTIGLKIKQGRLYVYCSRFVPQKEIERVIREKKNWIYRHLYAEKKNAKPSFQQGSDIYFLGNKYRLNLIIRKEKEIQFAGDQLYLCGSSPAVIARMWNEYCIQYLDGIIRQFIAQDNSGLGNFSVKYKKYTGKWGCCVSARREITFNVYAVSLPVETIKYLFYHELAHLKVSNHQKPFYDLLSKLYPDYRSQLKILKSYSIE